MSITLCTYVHLEGSKKVPSSPSRRGKSHLTKNALNILCNIDILVAQSLTDCASLRFALVSRLRCGVTRSNGKNYVFSNADKKEKLRRIFQEPSRRKIHSNQKETSSQHSGRERSLFLKTLEARR